MADGEELYEEEVGAEGYEEEEEQEEAGAGEEYGEGEATAEDLEAMQRKLKEMEEEAARLKAVVGAGSDGAATAAGTAATAAAAAAAAAANAAADLAAKAEVDSRSIYIGSVDYACTPEELQQHFAQCGTVNRVTILTDRFGSPKGYAYLEFLEVDAVQNALLLDNSELRGRQIKVSAKRTNQPGLKVRGRGRGRGFPPAYGGRGFYPPPFAGGRGRGGYYGGYYGAPGYAPRGRGRGRGAFYAPY